MNTTEIMDLSLELARMDETPPDCAVYVPGEDIRRVFLGVDIDSGELWIARELGFDLVIAHHPVGGESRLRFPEVLRYHLDQMVDAGVPRDVAREAIRDKVEEREIMAHVSNYDRLPSIARLLGLSFMNIHTPLDWICRRRLSEVISRVPEEAPVSDLLEAFYDRLPEFRNAGTRIDVRAGDERNRVGRTVVSIGAGTNGGHPVAKAYFDHGVDTLIYMHCKHEDSRTIREDYGTSGKTFLVTGHMAGDSVGINPFADALEKRGLEVTRACGIVPGDGQGR
jgi:putative NIF3 family GTP cyclohydrolase 1 type 2